jgi:chromosome segregation ATPase
VNDALLPIVASGTLSGGLVLGVVQAYRAVKTAPSERDSLIVKGAETAVVALERSLAAETRRADRAEKQVADRDAQLERLQERLEAMQVALDEVRRELHDLLAKK